MSKSCKRVTSDMTGKGSCKDKTKVAGDSHLIVSSPSFMNKIK